MLLQVRPIPSFQLRTIGALQAREPHTKFVAPAVNTHATELYCQNNGNNINAGSTTDANAIYTSTNGNWSTTTKTFIPTDGSNPVANGVAADQLASIYIDGATTAVFLARIVSVTNDVNGPIVVDTITRCYGTAPVTSATGRSIKVGGAWFGPSGSSLFPWGLGGNAISSLFNLQGDQVRLNLKNDRTYSVTTLFAMACGKTIIQGYTSTPGDGGVASLTSNVTSSQNFTSANQQMFADIDFSSTAASFSPDLFSASGEPVFWRCRFHGCRGIALNASTSIGYAIECEFYDCCNGNSGACAVNVGSTGSNAIVLHDCYIHDLTQGSALSSSAGGQIVLFNSLIDSINGHAAIYTGQNPIAICAVNNSFYNIAGDVFRNVGGVVSSSQGFYMFFNNIYENIGGQIYNFPTMTGTIIASNQSGISANNSRFNARGVDTARSMLFPGGDVVPPSTAFASAPTGDFSLVAQALIGTGRAKFIQTGSGKSGTTSFPDIGAAQSSPNLFSLGGAIGTQSLPPGYVNHDYYWKWNVASTVTLRSGSLPTGLVLTQVSPTLVTITGTPTTVGTYDFVLRSTAGTSITDYNFEIIILADPDEGSSFVGGL